MSAMAQRNYRELQTPGILPENRSANIFALNFFLIDLDLHLGAHMPKITLLISQVPFPCLESLALKSCDFLCHEFPKDKNFEMEKRLISVEITLS